MISKFYTIISNKLWDLSLYFEDLYNRWVLVSQQKALGPCKCARFREMQTYRNYSFSYFLTFVSVLKTRSFFSWKFFQGHNWLTNYPDSEFHGHWKTVTLSSISPNLSKHWRFLAFWLSLCFGSCLSLLPFVPLCYPVLLCVPLCYTVLPCVPLCYPVLPCVTLC